jgi:hypothetical protein
MMLSISHPLAERKDRPSADTTPAVIVDDSDDKLAPPQSFRVAKRRCWSAGGQLGTQQGQISVGVVTKHPCLSFTIFSECKTHSLGAPDHVTVGQDETVAGNNHPGADPALPATLIAAFDADNCRPDTVGHGGNRTRIGVERCLVRRVAGRVHAAWGVKHGANLKD